MASCQTAWNGELTVKAAWSLDGHVVHPIYLWEWCAAHISKDTALLLEINYLQFKKTREGNCVDTIYLKKQNTHTQGKQAHFLWSIQKEIVNTVEH